MDSESLRENARQNFIRWCQRYLSEMDSGEISSELCFSNIMLRFLSLSWSDGVEFRAWWKDCLDEFPAAKLAQFDEWLRRTIDSWDEEQYGRIFMADTRDPDQVTAVTQSLRPHCESLCALVHSRVRARSVQEP